MRYGIVINLDYENHSYETTHLVWSHIKDRLIEVGFRPEGRIFTIDLPEERACQLAREVVESIEDHLEPFDRHIYRYIKEFYGVDLKHTVNLLLPPAEAIQVEGG